MNHYRKGKFAKLKRKQPGQMNKTEVKYYEKLLIDKADNLIKWFSYEKLKFKVGDSSWYTPDFMIIDLHDQLVIDEIKGSYILDNTGIVKFKAACQQYPFIHFRLWVYDDKNKTFELRKEN